MFYGLCNGLCIGLCRFFGVFLWVVYGFLDGEIWRISSPIHMKHPLVTMVDVGNKNTYD